MSFSFQDAAGADRDTKYSNKADGGLTKPTFASHASDTAPGPTQGPTDGSPGSGPANDLKITCTGVDVNHNIFKPNQDISITCSAVPDVEIAAVEWIVYGTPPTTLHSHKATDPDSPGDDKSGFSGK